MFEPVSAGMVVGALATSEIIKSAVGGFIGNRADAGAKWASSALTKALASPHEPRNHDVLAATHAAYTQSLQWFAAECRHRFNQYNRATPDERTAVDRIVKYVADPALTEFNPGPADITDAAIDAAITALFGRAGQAGPLTAVAADALTTLEASTGALPPRLAMLFTSGEADCRSWPQTFELLFAEQVKTKPRVQAITTFAGLETLKAQGFDLSLRVDELVGEARRHGEAIAALREQVIDFWTDMARLFAASEARQAERHAEAMAKMARMEAQIEILVARNNTGSAGDTEGLLRGRVSELLRLNRDATLADIDASLKSALTERDALKAELDALRAEDNRIAGLIGSAEAAIDEGRLAETRGYLDQAITVHDERERAARTAKAGLLAAKARTYLLALDYPAALNLLDESAAAEPDLAKSLNRRMQAAETANEWGERTAGSSALTSAIDRWRDLVNAYADCGDHQRRAGALKGLGDALRALGERQDNATMLHDAIAAFTEALEVFTFDAMPLEWAATKNSLGIALEQLGARQEDSSALHAAVAACTDALRVYTFDGMPSEWAATKNSLSIALQTLGARQGDVNALQAAVAACADALKVYTFDAMPFYWATTNHSLGSALARLGAVQADAATLHAAVSAYTDALKVRTFDTLPLAWAATKNNLGIALRILGKQQNDANALQDAIDSYTDALKVYTFDLLPLDWAMTKNNLGAALATLGECHDDAAALHDAVAAYTDALKIRTFDALPLEWAGTKNNLAFVHLSLACLELDPVHAEAAVSELRDALTVFAHPNLAWNRAKAERGLALAEALIAELCDN